MLGVFQVKGNSFCYSLRQGFNERKKILSSLFVAKLCAQNERNAKVTKIGSFARV